MSRPITFSMFTENGPRKAVQRWLRQAEGSAILEFAIALPLLVVFVVGIYDFGGAFNQKQKIEQAAQEAAIIAAAQPTSDLQPVAGSTKNPDSLLPVVTAVVNSLDGSGVINSASCAAPKTAGPSGSHPTLTWTYTISGCSSLNSKDNLVITINRGWIAAISKSGQSGLYAVGTKVTVAYPYNWRFNSVIQVLIPGANYAPETNLSESATVHSQM
jgi:Flp pilus assembly protein TadG